MRMLDTGGTFERLETENFAMFLSGWNGPKLYPGTPRSPSSSPRRRILRQTTQSFAQPDQQSPIYRKSNSLGTSAPNSMNCECLEDELRFLRHQVLLKDRTIAELQSTVTLLSARARKPSSYTGRNTKASFGETSDCSDSHLQIDTSENTTKLESRRFHAKSAAQSDRIPDSSRVQTSRSRQMSVSRSKPRDEVDEVVQEYLRETDQVGRLRWLSYGVYLLGTKKIGVTVKNGKPLVRIGGGAFVHLDLYFVTH